MPKKRTPTIARLRAAMDGCIAAAEIRYVEVAIRPMPLTIVKQPKTLASIIHPLSGTTRASKRRKVVFIHVFLHMLSLIACRDHSAASEFGGCQSRRCVHYQAQESDLRQRWCSSGVLRSGRFAHT